MDHDEGMREVDFNKYCKTCVHKDIKEEDDPCYECLDEPMRQYSHKPVKYEGKD